MVAINIDNSNTDKLFIDEDRANQSERIANVGLYMLTKWNMDAFCEGIELKGKTVLDVGCGNGVLGQYALERGAKSVVGLEPMSAGSSVMPDNRNVSFEVLPVRIQDFDTHDKFDLIMLYDSINHLDEDACIHLRDSHEAQVRYLAIILKLHERLNDGGQVVIADASSRNLFADLGIRNPFDGSIEWHKHQTPNFWVCFLGSCGFKNPEVTWLTPWQLRVFGKLVGNRITSYFLVSHFRLVMKKPQEL